MCRSTFGRCRCLTPTQATAAGDGSLAEPPFHGFVAGTLGLLLTRGEVLPFMAFPTVSPPGGSPTLSVFEPRVSGHFCPSWVDPSRNLLTTACSRHPWGSPTPRGGPALRGIPTVDCRSDIGMLSVGNLGQCVLFWTYTHGLFSPPHRSIYLLVRFSCAGFWVVVLLELLQVSPRSPEHMLSLRGLGA